MTLYKNKYRVESTRLKHWDYAANGSYFVTICTHDRIRYFGKICDRKMQRSQIGEIAQQFWQDVPNHHPHVCLDAYVIMPDHVHGIIVINRDRPVETRHVASLRSTPQPTDQPNPHPTDPSNTFAPLKPGSLQAIIQSYKASVTRWCRKNNYPNFAWQPRFHDSIIRDPESLNRIRIYIQNNPAKWQNAASSRKS